jgi:hypothetical protein
MLPLQIGNIVSKQIKHKGGIARVEQDKEGFLFVVCSGCRSVTEKAGMAPALQELTSRHG